MVLASVLAVISDVVWQALIAAAVTLVMAWLNQRTKSAVDTAAKDAAVKVETVKTTLKDVTEKQTSQLLEIAKTGDAVHTLVNSNMGVQLKLVAELSRWKANQTKARADIEAAELADKMLREHEGKQATVDASKP